MIKANLRAFRPADGFFERNAGGVQKKGDTVFDVLKDITKKKKEGFSWNIPLQRYMEVIILRASIICMNLTAGNCPVGNIA